MKALRHEIIITGKIEFSKRELDLLTNFLSYDIHSYIRTITPNSYEGGVSLEEMANFIATLQVNVSQVKELIKKDLDKITTQG